MLLLVIVLPGRPRRIAGVRVSVTVAVDVAESPIGAAAAGSAAATRLGGGAGDTARVVARFGDGAVTYGLGFGRTVVVAIPLLLQPLLLQELHLLLQLLVLFREGLRHKSRGKPAQ